MIASIILALYLMGMIPPESAIVLLYIAGALLIFAEMFLGTFGISALNGLIAFYVAYSIQSGVVQLFGLPIDWSLLFGVAIFEVALLGGMLIAMMRLRGKGVTTGTESMVGKTAKIIEWDKNSGRVMIQGEAWKATSDKVLDLAENDSVSVEAVDNLELKIRADS